MRFISGLALLVAGLGCSPGNVEACVEARGRIRAAYDACSLPPPERPLVCDEILDQSGADCVEYFRCVGAAHTCDAEANAVRAETDSCGGCT